MISAVASSTAAAAPPEVEPATSRARRGPTGPVRTCVGCRGRAPAIALFRVVVAPEPAGDTAVRLVADPRRRLPGRGAWLHPDPQCVAQAQRRRAFARALRLGSAPDLTAVVEFVATTGTDSAAGADVGQDGQRTDAGRTRTTNEQESDEPQGHSMKRQK